MDLLTAMGVFCKVAETGAFTRAADRLGISTTAASRHVAELEAHLGARLIYRSTRRLSLTDPGRAYYERCAQILADVDEAGALAGRGAIEPRGVLRLNLPVSFGVLQVAPLLPEYARRCPEVTVDLSLSDRVVDLVEEGYDLALRIARDLRTTLVARRITTARMVACAAPAYLDRRGAPRVPADLARHDCLAYTYAASGSQWQFREPGGTVHAVSVKGRLQANNGDALRIAALGGMGIAVEPSFLVGDDLREGRLRRVLADFEVPAFAVYAIYPSHRHLSAKVRTFVDFLGERFGEPPPWDGWVGQVP